MFGLRKLTLIRALHRIPNYTRSRISLVNNQNYCEIFAVKLHLQTPATAGHNKWSKIKHKKFAADQEKSKLYAKLSVEISTSVRQSGDDPDTNIRLASALSRAKQQGMPKATVEKAISSGRGPSKGQSAESVLYEGRSPGGVLYLIEVLTTNKNRTRPELRNLLDKHGGSLGEPGSSSFMFDHKGVVTISQNEFPEECDPFEMAIEVGAEDVTDEEDMTGLPSYCFVCDPQQLKKVTDAITLRGLSLSSSTLEYIPRSPVGLSSVQYGKAASLVELIEDHQDVIRVHSNFEMLEE